MDWQPTMDMISSSLVWSASSSEHDVFLNSDRGSQEMDGSFETAEKHRLIKATDFVDSKKARAVELIVRQVLQKKNMTAAKPSLVGMIKSSAVRGICNFSEVSGTFIRRLHSWEQSQIYWRKKPNEYEVEGSKSDIKFPDVGGRLIVNRRDKSILRLFRGWNLWEQLQIHRQKELIEFEVEGGASSQRNDTSNLNMGRRFEHTADDLIQEEIGHVGEQKKDDQHLEELYLSRSTMQELPASICLKKNLHILNLDDCHLLEKLPDGIKNLCLLEELSLSKCPMIKKLPDTIVSLKSLRRLNLSGCKQFEVLPDHIGELESLTELLLESTLLVQLPESVGCLKKLEILHLGSCDKLEGLPSSIGNLKNLTQLLLDRTNIKKLPSEILLLKKLELLSVRGCSARNDLPRELIIKENLLLLLGEWQVDEIPSCQLNDERFTAPICCAHEGRHRQV